MPTLPATDDPLTAGQMVINGLKVCTLSASSVAVVVVAKGAVVTVSARELFGDDVTIGLIDIGFLRNFHQDLTA